MRAPQAFLDKLRASRTGLHSSITDATTDASSMLEETTAERVATDDALHTLLPVAASPSLQLRLRVALSHERVRAERRWTGRVAHRWHLVRQNTLHRYAIQAAVGASAFVMLVGIGLNLGTVTAAQTVEANDIPLVGFSSPHYLYSSSGLHQPIVSADGAAVVVEAKVNAEGRVYDYRVLSGSLDSTGVKALRERMVGGVFKPARILGEPVRGKIVLTFADVEVHG